MKRLQGPLPRTEKCLFDFLVIILKKQIYHGPTSTYSEIGSWVLFLDWGFSKNIVKFVVFWNSHCQWLIKIFTSVYFYSLSFYCKPLHRLFCCMSLSAWKSFLVSICAQFHVCSSTHDPYTLLLSSRPHWITALENSTTLLYRPAYCRNFQWIIGSQMGLDNS
jgi:hypothetical protein